MRVCTALKPSNSIKYGLEVNIEQQYLFDLFQRRSLYLIHSFLVYIINSL